MALQLARIARKAPAEARSLAAAGYGIDAILGAASCPGISAILVAILHNRTEKRQQRELPGHVW
jgi:hypothetical protein